LDKKEIEIRAVVVVSFNNNTTGVTSGAETAHPSGAHEFTPGF
jgi:hypothetical protein